MDKVEIGDWLLVKDTQIIYEVVNSVKSSIKNFNKKVSIRPINSKEIFSIYSKDLIYFKNIGNPKDNKSIGLLYG